MRSNEEKDGGQAFPAQAMFSPEMGTVAGWDGMSLRDWYAGQALAGLSGAALRDYDEIASQAFNMADAMICERAKR